MCFTGSDWGLLSFNSFVLIGSLLKWCTHTFVDGLFYRQPFRYLRPDIRPRYSVLSPARYGSVCTSCLFEAVIPNSEFRISHSELLLHPKGAPFPSCGSQSFVVPWSGTKTLTATPSSPRCIVRRTRFGDDASRREAHSHHRYRGPPPS